MRLSIGDFAQHLRNFVKAEDQLAGICPVCKNLVRVSEMELFYIPDRKDDVLQMLREKERTLNEQESAIRADAAKRSRAALLGSLMEQVGPVLPGFDYDLNDLRALWDPVDLIAFNGIGVNRKVESITFIEIKSGKSQQLTPVEKTIQHAVEEGRVKFETVERNLLPRESSDSSDFEQRGSRQVKP